MLRKPLKSSLNIKSLQSETLGSLGRGFLVLDFFVSDFRGFGGVFKARFRASSRRRTVSLSSSV